MKKTILLIFLMSGIYSSTFSQSFFDKLGAGINFDIKSPYGQLRDNGLTNFYGLSIEAFYVGCTDKKWRFTPGYRIGAGITESIWGDNILLSEPEGAEATRRLFNTYFGVELVGRLIYENDNRIRPYAELYAGFRGVNAHETFSLTEPVEGYSNNTENVFSNASNIVGIGIGVLVQLSDVIDLNVKIASEYSGQVYHSNLNGDEFYSTQRIESNNSYNHNFSIGIFFRPKCGRITDSYTNKRTNYINSGYTPRPKQTKPIQKRSRTIQK